MFWAPFPSYAQLIVAEGFSASVLVNNVLIGDGVQTRNAKFTGYDRAVGLFENGDKSDLGIDKGIILSSGIAVGAKGPNDDPGFTSGEGGPGHPILEKIAGIQTLDAAELSFEFKPQTSHVEFKYIFASDEYKEWVDAGFNDIFGFFISGPGISGEQNVALLPGNSIEVSIDNVNQKRNTQYFRDNAVLNTTLHKNIQADGLTVVLKASLVLQPCEWYTIKLAITDVGDPIKDSWVFVESKSFKHETLLGNDTSYCDSDFVRTLKSGYEDKQVKWSTGDTSHEIVVKDYGSYWVEVFTACGSFKDEIEIYPTVIDIDLGNDTSVCFGQSELKLGVKDRVFDSYKWSTGDTTDYLNVSTAGVYSLTVGRNGCYVSDSIHVTDGATPYFDLGSDTTICGNVDLVLAPHISGDTFQWSDGTNQSYITAKQSGKYFLTIWRKGCWYSDTISIRNIVEPKFDLGEENILLCEASELTFDTRLRDTINYKFLWSTGDTSPWIQVNTGGQFSVLVTNVECGFSASDQVVVTMLSEGQNFYVPNSFTPNADELNENFKPVFQFTDVTAYHFSIYNKWGQKIFETSDPNEFWDGKFNGEYVKPDVYIWDCQIRSTCLPDPLQYKHGTVSVLR
ncbi:MAG: T9SS type B sorting domain-containing protein [Bacteroidetes bacterium]|nr:T9SS type B sorting domain-containing protein [Bacteroidota bacterium]